MKEALKPLTKYAIKECVFGPNHIAFLLQDGRICRIKFRLKVDSNSKCDKKKPKNSDSRNDGGSGGGGKESLRSSSSSRILRSSLGIFSRGRSLNFLREIHRQGLYLGRQTPQIPASEVPELLIEQCINVLQGKSRQMIIRELQRTNLDVNMAVNNLLSRDDEAEQPSSLLVNSSRGLVGVDIDEDADDLLTLFENVDGSQFLFEPELITDDYVDSLSPSAEMGAALESSDNSTSEQRKRRRFETLLRGVSAKNYQRQNDDSFRNDEDSNQSSKSDKASSSSNFQFIGGLEWWYDPLSSKTEECRFSAIASLHSELIAIGLDNGQLYQWKWSACTPFFQKIRDANPPTVVYHPRSMGLNLVGERVTHLSACITRATLHTSSDKFATWFDESLSNTLNLSRFEHAATNWSLLTRKNERLVSLHTSPFVTVIRCASGCVYWWGVFPSYMRQKALDKSREVTTSRSATGTPKKNSQLIAPGTFVCMKNAPIFHAGAVGFAIINGVPKIGTLLEDAWKLTDMCRFMVRPLASQNSKDSAANKEPEPITSPLQQHSLTCVHAQTALASTQQQQGPETMHRSNPSSQPTSAAPSPQTSNQAAPTTSLVLASTTEPTPSSFEMPPPPSPASSTCSEHSYQGNNQRKKTGTTQPVTTERERPHSAEWGEAVPLWAGAASNQGAMGTNQNFASMPPRGIRGRSIDREMSMASLSISGGTSPYRRPASVTSLPPGRTPSPAAASQTSKPETQTESRGTEEDWCLNDVVFVEDGRTQPVGIVIKVDGTIAAVKFLKEQERSCIAANCPYSPAVAMLQNIVPNQGAQSSSTTPQEPDVDGALKGAQSGSNADPMSWLTECRLLSQEDLAVVRQAASPSSVPEFFQSKPVRLCGFSSSISILGMAVECDLLHVLMYRPSPSIAPTLGERYSEAAEECHNKSPKIRGLNWFCLCLNGEPKPMQRLPVNDRIFAPLPSSVSMVTDRDDLLVAKAEITCPYGAPFMVRGANGLVFPFQPPNLITSTLLNQFGVSNGLQASVNNASSGGSSSSLWVTPEWLNLPPVQCAAITWHTSALSSSQLLASHPLWKAVASEAAPGEVIVKPANSSNNGPSSHMLGLIVLKELQLMPHILRADDVRVAQILAEHASNEQELNSLCEEKLDGLRNILHVAICMCQPVSNRENDWTSKLQAALQGHEEEPAGEKSGPRGARDSLPQSLYQLRQSARAGGATGRSYSSYHSSLSMSEFFVLRSGNLGSAASEGGARTEEDSPQPPVRSSSLHSSVPGHLWQWPPVQKDSELARRIASCRIVHLLIGPQSPLRRNPLSRLLKECCAEGLTPFRMAIKYRAYLVAEYMLDNDSCSFTWTGPDHIKQDIFECRTCGLTETLCCCTECARACHKGHDCRLKRTSPTAYCDCWERCRCSSLVTGHLPSRHSLFHKLLTSTNLIDVPSCNAVSTGHHSKSSNFLSSHAGGASSNRGEHLMLYLAKCVDRQHKEQKQYRPSRRRIAGSRKNYYSRRGDQVESKSTRLAIGEEPEHDLDPPRFCRDALELALDCPRAIISLFFTGLTTSPSKLFLSNVMRSKKRAPLLDCDTAPNPSIDENDVSLHAHLAK
ncbi:E3 ubiquitin-protein ligase ubr5 [Cichlidogyrus casuarinus]|uniref:E3 ubiquitin-protein ligase ubr5 n=1 Tax=Cichlidogyrus casuarinus TaxID=1844966 RepID=A0ABD2QGB3_9PLAT